MSDEGAKQQWIRRIMPILYRRRGYHQVLEKEFENLSLEALEALYRILDDFEQEVHRLEHTFRPFPGGPRIHM